MNFFVAQTVCSFFSRILGCDITSFKTAFEIVPSCSCFNCIVMDSLEAISEVRSLVALPSVSSGVVSLGIDRFPLLALVDDIVRVATAFSGMLFAIQYSLSLPCLLFVTRLIGVAGTTISVSAGIFVFVSFFLCFSVFVVVIWRCERISDFVRISSLLETLVGVKLTEPLCTKSIILLGELCLVFVPRLCFLARRGGVKHFLTRKQCCLPSFLNTSILMTSLTFKINSSSSAIVLDLSILF
mmetsp:Transcript_24137/g.35766  ORF Transcript_24137/g.35766 Transcript_24137/m.35766 type:complete len:241 (+) Transcript_24137:1482-2204(+)